MEVLQRPGVDHVAEDANGIAFGTVQCDDGDVIEDFPSLLY
jgi:hypothetical protein